MKNRLNNINLIKKIMIGLMLICFCVVGINTYNIDIVYAQDPQLKTKTFWVNSNQPVSISFKQNEDKTKITKDGWHQGGTIKCYSEKSTKSGYEYQYKIVMDKVNVTHYTPYIVVTADQNDTYRPNGTSDISLPSDYQYGQDGMSRGGNQCHNLETYMHNDEMQVYIGLGFTQSRFAVNFVSKADYGLKWHISFNSNGGSYCNPISGAYNTPATLPTSTQKGYTFNGWSGELGVYGFINNLKGRTGNITWGTWTDYYTTLTAKFTANPYYVSFKAQKPSTANSEPNDGKKTFTSPFGDTIRTNPNNYKYDTKYAAEFYPKGFWANGECTTLDEMSDARQGKNEAAARYMLAGGSSQMTQEIFDQQYLSDEEFYAKYGWHLSKYQQ